jgi:16S rRNA (guanine527-N7)-methyltransferase
MGDRLTPLLIEAQQQGFIGPGDVQPHIDHALGFVAALGSDTVPERVVDLGSGGGLPSLVLAASWPESRFWLIEANQRRVRFLADAVDRLGWGDRVQARNGRAEVFGREVDLRGTMDLVTARGFGPPAVTAECAAPFLAPGGRLVVSEPPTSEGADDASRWPPTGLAMVGLAPEQVAPGLPAHYAVFAQQDRCPDRYPRRVGIPVKRPLF